MSAFAYSGGRYCAEQVPLSAVAERFGTPCYVYSRKAVEDRWRAYDRAFGSRPHLVCYAVKANSNLALLGLMARMGSGFDIVSGGELKRVLAAGGAASGVVFSGVGKRTEEMQSALEAGIRCFNVESGAELRRLAQVARKCGTAARIAVRVNPDVDPGTHPYIATGLRDSKFGVSAHDALSLYREAATLDYIDVAGIACHVGSQITSLSPYLDAVDRVLELCDRLQDEGTALHHIDMGGGLGIRYRDETPPAPGELVAALCERLHDWRLELLLEPGRSLVGEAGVLLTRVEYLKHNGSRLFAVVDAAMNDLLRPALYDAWMEILPVEESDGVAGETCDVVGPVCESSDFLGRDRRLAIAEGDLLAVCSAGAYGASMASNYNSRPRPAEIMVDGGEMHEIRRRERFVDLARGESVLPSTRKVR